MAKAQTGSSTDVIFETLEEQIATGIIQSGERLEEAALAEQFGVSRTPVREAFARLDSAGLIEKRAGQRGYFASSPSFTSLIEMFEVMAELEGFCARLAARRMSESDIARLIEANDACKQAISTKDADLYYQRNVEFHEIIYDGCGNSFLAQETRDIRRRLRSYRRLQLRVRGRMNQSFQEHDGVIAAINNGDAELAAKLSRDHVAIQGERFADLVAHL